MSTMLVLYAHGVDTIEKASGPAVQKPRACLVLLHAIESAVDYTSMRELESQFE